MATVPPIPLFGKPGTRPGLLALAAYLIEADYTGESRYRILDRVAREGTLAGCVELDPGDMADAEAAYVDNLEAVPQTAREWEDDATWAPVLVDVSPAGLEAAALELCGPPPVRGGAPDAGPHPQDGEFPRDWTAEERARFRADIAEFYRLHPDA